MIDSPNDNITLSDEDARKIELGRIRLSTLQGEVLHATKRLATIADEENKARDACTYAEDQKAAIEKDVEALKAQAAELEKAIASSNDTLAQHEESHAQMRKEHEEKNTELDAREKSVKELESNLATRMDNHAKNEKDLEAKRSDVEKAQKAFTTALESVTWK